MSRPVPAQLRNLPAIDDRARDGKYRLIGNAAQFAVARWAESDWVFPSGHPVDFTPDRYQP